MRVENRKRYERIRLISEAQRQKAQATLGTLQLQCSAVRQSLEKNELQFKQIVARLKKSPDLQQEPAGALLRARVSFSELLPLKLRCELFREKESFFAHARNLTVNEMRKADMSVKTMTVTISAMDKLVKEIAAEQQEEEILSLTAAETTLQHDFEVECGQIPAHAQSIINEECGTTYEFTEGTGSHSGSSSEQNAVCSPRNESGMGRKVPAAVIHQLAAINGITKIAFTKSQVTFDYRSSSGETLSVYVRYTNNAELIVSIIAPDRNLTRRAAAARELLRILRSQGFTNVRVQLSGTLT